MKYKITHTTTYQYQSPVRVCHNLVLLTPREESHIRCLGHRLVIQPHPPIMHLRVDVFGNQMHAFSIEESHRQLRVTASSRVEVMPRADLDPLLTPAWDVLVAKLASQDEPNWLEASMYRYDSRRIERSAQFAEYARSAFTKGRPILDAALAFTAKIHREFKYDAQATSVSTNPTEAFALRRGVCQDFSHIAISSLRSLGIPTRYVSGYLRTVPPPGKPRLIGADQSHAWFSIYCGHERGWIDMDPTNNCICRSDHIPIAWGRDYQDVVPLRGVFLGGGNHTLTVSVDVMPLENATAS